MMMKKYVILLALVLLIGGLFGCVGAERAMEDVGQGMAEWEGKPIHNILLVGEGGPSGYMNMKAAETFKREHAEDVNEIYDLHDGDDFVAGVKDFVEKHGYVTHLEYFGHGNEKGLYVNQEPGVHGGLYANDPRLNEIYRAGSILELGADIFEPRGYIRLNGCNVAQGHPEYDTLAQRFADYFDVDVVAPLGPTEFSTNPDFAAPIDGANYLKPDWSGDVYMVPTVAKDGFVVVKPRPRLEGFFEDVREGQSFVEGALGMVEEGLDLGFGGCVEDGECAGERFNPYMVVTYGEAVKFCEVAVGDADLCDMEGHPEGEFIRNLKALQMLVDAFGVKVGWTDPWHRAYTSWADGQGILTEDFIQKKWYTRGEMAELTWNLMQVDL